MKALFYGHVIKANLTGRILENFNRENQERTPWRLLEDLGDTFRCRLKVISLLCFFFLISLLYALISFEKNCKYLLFKHSYTFEAKTETSF